jgi:hypothetical protein
VTEGPIPSSSTGAHSRVCITNPCSQVRAECSHAAVLWGSNSMGECQLCKLEVTGSSPVSSTDRVTRTLANPGVHGFERREGESVDLVPSFSGRTYACLAYHEGSIPFGTAISHHTVVVQRLGRLPV